MFELLVFKLESLGLHPSITCEEDIYNVNLLCQMEFKTFKQVFQYLSRDVDFNSFIKTQT
jgi:hypothetical protein